MVALPLVLKAGPASTIRIVERWHQWRDNRPLLTAYSASASNTKPAASRQCRVAEVINEYQQQWSAITGTGGQLARNMHLVQNKARPNSVALTKNLMVCNPIDTGVSSH